MWNRAGTAVDPSLTRRPVRADGEVGSGVGAHGVLVGGGAAGGRPAAELHRHRPRGGARGRAPRRPPAGGHLHAGLGARLPGDRELARPGCRPTTPRTSPALSGATARRAPSGTSIPSCPRSRSGAGRSGTSPTSTTTGTPRAASSGPTHYALLLKDAYRRDQAGRPRRHGRGRRPRELPLDATSRPIYKAGAREVTWTWWPSTRSPVYPGA